MKIPLYQVDAFTGTLFKGNPAAVCLLEEWLDEELMQAISAENNLSETAFVVRREKNYDLRWFTPVTEVDLCGHATLATAHVIFTSLEPSSTRVDFSTKSGTLTVTREKALISMDFPARPATPCAIPKELTQSLGTQPEEVLLSRDYLVVIDSEETLRSLWPNMEQLLMLDCLGVIVTARGEHADFVSRFFAPKAGIPEDPVTGSAHCTLVPYWSKKLQKKQLYTQQLSRRGGELFCEDQGERVKISGTGVTYFEGWIQL